jgi:hypothetical protein
VTLSVDPFTLLALSVMVIAPVRLPTAFGSKAVERVQLPAGASVLPQVVTGVVKSPAFGPVMAMPVIFSVSVPGFVKVTICDAVVVPMYVFA